MNKKLPLIIISIVIITLIIGILVYVFSSGMGQLTGFGFGGSQSNEPVTLNMWGLYENPEVFNQIAQNYAVENPNFNLNYDDRSVLRPQEYKERMFSRLSSGSADQDIVLLHNSWIPQLAPYLSSAPENLFNPSSYAENYYSSAVDSAVIGGSIYAVPAFYDGLVLVYNRDHFEDIDQLQAPTTWEEFRRIAIDLTIQGSNDEIVRSGAAIGNANNIDFATDIVGLLFSQTDVIVPDNMDSRAAQDAMSFYTSFTKEYNIWNDQFIEASSAFVQGQVSMIFVPTWNILDIIQANPNLNIGVAPVPQARPSNPVNWASFWMYAVPENSQNKEEAWRFISYLSSPDQQTLASSVSSRYRQFSAPFALKEMSSQTISPYVSPIYENADVSRTGILTARAGNINEENIIKDVINAILNARETELSIPELLRSAKNEIVSSNR